MVFTVERVSNFQPGSDEQPCPLTTWDIDKRAWVIKIETLDTLASFQQALGEPILLEGTKLEIYDERN